MDEKLNKKQKENEGRNKKGKKSDQRRCVQDASRKALTISHWIDGRSASSA